MTALLRRLDAMGLSRDEAGPLLPIGLRTRARFSRLLVERYRRRDESFGLATQREIEAELAAGGAVDPAEAIRPGLRLSASDLSPRQLRRLVRSRVPAIVEGSWTMPSRSTGGASTIS